MSKINIGGYGYVSAVLINGRTLASVCMGEYEGAPQAVAGAKAVAEQSDDTRYNPEYLDMTIESINPEEEKRTIGGDLESHRVLNRKSRIRFIMPPLTQEEAENLTHYLKLNEKSEEDASLHITYRDMRGVRENVKMYVDMTLAAEMSPSLLRQDKTKWKGLQLTFVEM